MIEITRIDHLVLRTTKLEAMLDFYCNILNCTIERESNKAMGLIQLRAGDALIDLVTVESEMGRKGGTAPGKTGNNLDHFCLQLKNITEANILAHLAQHGIENAKFENRYGAQGMGRSVYIEDPQGNTVELRSEIV